ncbi:MAG: hypothetical protein ThorAB25_25810 [Candidatus Thorarchaeota archaeon AB_25]|nr:MAG: hypothetical protein ThorAB25_25810 [Candidatus Thorarchaeota archaeon AB_25]
MGRKKEKKRGCMNPLFEFTSIVAFLGGKGGILDQNFPVS